MPAFEVPLSEAALQSLAVGALALLLWAMASQFPPILRRRLARDGQPNRWVSSAAWPVVGRIFVVVYAVGFLYLTLRGGLLDPIQAGLVPVDWGELAGWLPAVAGLTALWTALLWGAYWHRLRPALDVSPGATYGTFLGLPAHLVGEEAWAAILRGALTPALGLYWGAWSAALIRVLASLLSPAVRRRRGHGAQRPFVYLDWAMEAVAAGCFAITGSLWASLIARGAGHLAANMVHRGLYLWSRRQERRLPAETS